MNEQQFKCDPRDARDLRLIRLALAEFLQAQAPATQSIEIPNEIHEFFSKIGRQFGGLGGYKRAMNQTKAERQEHARKASQARWDKQRKREQIAA